MQCKERLYVLRVAANPLDQGYCLSQSSSMITAVLQRNSNSIICLAYLILSQIVGSYDKRSLSSEIEGYLFYGVFT